MSKQCAKCPWKVTTNPHDIPGGYSERKHAALAGTIAQPGSLRGLGVSLRMMACHETTGGTERPCIGWLAHQLGPGNNIALRLSAMSGRLPDIELVGEQHETFEATLPRRRKRAS